MTHSHHNASRRQLLRLMPLAFAAPFLINACTPTPRIYAMEVSRDVGCMCCHAWADLMKASTRFTVTLKEGEDLPALKQRLGVPPDLGSCHTAVVDDYVIVGHVPAEDILRLLDERPAGVRGIAVPGMPRGSPGMEQPNGATDPYDVIAFRADGSSYVFARHEQATPARVLP